MSRNNRSKNGRECYLNLKGYLKKEAYEEKKYSKANDIIKSAHHDGNRMFTLDNYYNLFAKPFVQLEESDPVYTLSEAQNINEFENRLKDNRAINFSITAKRERNKLPTNHQTFDTYYNSISESYGILQSLVHSPGSRVNYHYKILQFNNGVHGRGGHGCIRGYVGR